MHWIHVIPLMQTFYFSREEYYQSSPLSWENELTGFPGSEGTSETFRGNDMAAWFQVPNCAAQSAAISTESTPIIGDTQMPRSASVNQSYLPAATVCKSIEWPHRQNVTETQTLQ